MRSMCTPISSRMFLRRSWVIGRGVTTPCCAKAIAVASTVPIQMGRYRSPVRSRSKTIGCWLGTSRRTPTRFSSIIGSPRPLYPPCPNPATGSGRGAEEPLERTRILHEPGVILERNDERKVPVSLLIVQTVADDESVRAVETAVADVQRRDPARPLVEERAHPDGRGAPRRERGEQVRERETRVDDVLDDQDVLPSDVVVEVLQDAHDTR